MKRLLIIMSLIIFTGCGAKAPALRMGSLWTQAELQSYDLTMSVSAMLFKAGAIDKDARKHIDRIAAESSALYKEVVLLSMDYRRNDTELYAYEMKIRKYHVKMVELVETIRAYMRMVEIEKKGG